MRDTCERWHQICRRKNTKISLDTTQLCYCTAAGSCVCMCVARVGSVSDPCLTTHPSLLVSVLGVCSFVLAATTFHGSVRGIFYRRLASFFVYSLLWTPDDRCLLKFQIVKPCQAGRSSWILYGYACERPKQTFKKRHGKGAAWWRGSATWLINTRVFTCTLVLCVRRLPQWRHLSTGASNPTRRAFLCRVGCVCTNYLYIPPRATSCAGAAASAAVRTCGRGYSVRMVGKRLVQTSRVSVKIVTQPIVSTAVSINPLCCRLLAGPVHRQTEENQTTKVHTIRGERGSNLAQKKK